MPDRLARLQTVEEIRVRMPLRNYPECKATFWRLRNILNQTFGPFWGCTLEVYGPQPTPPDMDTAVERFERCVLILGLGLPVRDFKEISALLDQAEASIDADIKLIWEAATQQRFRLPERMTCQDGTTIVPFPRLREGEPVSLTA